MGLIMASVVSQVTVPAKGKGPRLAWTILRPIVASGGMAIIAPPVAAWILLPCLRFVYHRTPRLGGQGPALLLLLLILAAFMTISNYTGSSMLFGAYAAGCVLRFLDEQLIETGVQSFELTFKEFIAPLNKYLFVPLFFAVIGTAVPFTSLWTPSILWKGAVYSVLMWFGKAVTGLCVLLWRGKEGLSTVTGEVNVALGNTTANDHGNIHIPEESQLRKDASFFSQERVYPALFISLAMVSRGEIALLIVQLGRPVLSEDLFLIVMWAIVVCTFVGALSTGFLVHRHLPRHMNKGWFRG